MIERKLQPISLMRYVCSVCGTEEVLWNSKEGYAPSSIVCQNCGGKEKSFHNKKLDVITKDDYNPKDFRWITYITTKQYETFLRKTKLSVIKEDEKEDIIKYLLDKYNPQENPSVKDRFDICEGLTKN